MLRTREKREQAIQGCVIGFKTLIHVVGRSMDSFSLLLVQNFINIHTTTTFQAKIVNEIRY